uniref:Pectate lyase n=1 Tax=Fagus sylvatica TaxID=28930 RepID=A0A2N9IUB2_FAGSY
MLSLEEKDQQQCLTGNPIDDCWRCDPNWQNNRQRLADCGIGFGRNSLGGKGGRIYTVTDSSDRDASNPVPGTLRHAVIQDEPLWIVFSADMSIKLQHELIFNSYKTVDGRGVNVHITGGRSDGDGISIFSARQIWIDHCALSYCTDGLIDAIMGSTAITISNNYFSHHDEVMLLGHNDAMTLDTGMQVTIALNHFGEALVQRMPRCRRGYIHVVNNDFTQWEMYAIGGSANPTINSQGNRYTAPSDDNAKEVTKRVDTEEGEWNDWNWRTEGDVMVNGAFFVPSGLGLSAQYAKASSVEPISAGLINQLTMNAGVIGGPRDDGETISYPGFNGGGTSTSTGTTNNGNGRSSDGDGGYLNMIFGNAAAPLAPSTTTSIFLSLFITLILYTITNHAVLLSLP